MVSTRVEGKSRLNRLRPDELDGRFPGLLAACSVQRGVTGGLATEIGLELLHRLEAHAVRAWPPETIENLHDGWVLRASPVPAAARRTRLTPPYRGRLCG